MCIKHKTFCFEIITISLINIVYFSSGKSQTGLDVPLHRDFIEKGELLVSVITVVHLSLVL